MATKLKCQKCGAKNALDAQRCRLCTAPLSGGLPSGIPGGRSAFSGGKGLGARIAAAGNAPTMPTPATPPEPPGAVGFPTDQPSFEPLDTGSFSDATGGGLSNEPTAPLAFEPFDPGALFDSPPAGDASSDEPGRDSEPFDPDALFRDS